jgi:thioesterase domain-containing protein
MTADRALQRYLHEHIPLSAAMGVSVLQLSDEKVVLAAPLQPNINHRNSVFGGSASALAILSAWSLVHTRLEGAGIRSRLVIQRNAIEYSKPILGDFSASATLKEPAKWPLFLRMLERRGRARIAVESALLYEGQAAGTFEGEFVAFSA